MTRPTIPPDAREMHSTRESIGASIRTVFVRAGMIDCLFVTINTHLAQFSRRFLQKTYVLAPRESTRSQIIAARKF